MDSARHVIGCHLTQDTRVQNASDDAASTIHESPPVLLLPAPCLRRRVQLRLHPVQAVAEGIFAPFTLPLVELQLLPAA